MRFVPFCALTAAVSLDKSRYYIDNVGAILAVLQAIIREGIGG